MAHDNFNDLRAFVAVARAGSFTKAAAQLGVSQSALSHTLRTLEQRLDIKLLHRTTRSVSPTEAGERLYQTVAPRFDDIEAELAALSELRDKPAGTVRITASEHAAGLIWPKLAVMLRNYPDIHIELNNDNRFTDIVAERYDIGVCLGDDIAKDMIAVRIAPDMHMAVVGSPDYLCRHGRPKIPQDLGGYHCIGLRLPTYGGLLVWEFMHNGRGSNVQIHSGLVFNSSSMTLQAALDGFGLTWVPRDMAQPHLDNGRLETVLEDWAAHYPGYHLYYSSRRSSAALSVVLDTLRWREADEAPPVPTE